MKFDSQSFLKQLKPIVGCLVFAMVEAVFVYKSSDYAWSVFVLFIFTVFAYGYLTSKPKQP